MNYTIDDILAFAGNFTIDTDNDGQIIIYTGLREDDEGSLTDKWEDEA
jgi:hypothetical protein